MYRFLLRPRWLALHAACLVLMVTMVNLGFWQLRRLDEKQSFNALVSANADADVAPLEEVLAEVTDGDLGAIEHRRVEVTGTFVDREFVVVNVSQQGDSGRDPVGALELDDGTLLIVNRGFSVGAAPLPPPPGGEVTLIGRVRASQEVRRGQVADDASQELTEIRRVNLDVLAQQFDAPLAPVYLEWLTYLPAQEVALVPVAFPTLDEGPHLSYALQWFIFTVCVVVGWVLAVRSHVTSASGRAPKRRRYVPIADDAPTM